MADYASLFTAPNPGMYNEPDADTLPAAATQNPFAVLPMLAARMRAEQGRQEYSDALASHDQRAQAGQAVLSDQDLRSKLMEQFFKGTATPTMQGEMLNMPTSRPEFADMDQFFMRGKQADVAKTQSEALQNDALAGQQPAAASDASDAIGMGRLAPYSNVLDSKRRAGDPHAGLVKLTKNYFPLPTGGFRYTTDQWVTPEEAVALGEKVDAAAAAATAASNTRVPPVGAGGRTPTDVPAPGAIAPEPQHATPTSDPAAPLVASPEGAANAAAIDQQQIAQTAVGPIPTSALSPKQTQSITAILQHIGVKPADLVRGGLIRDQQGHITVKFNTPRGVQVIRIDADGNPIKPG